MDQSPNIMLSERGQTKKREHTALFHLCIYNDTKQVRDHMGLKGRQMKQIQKAMKKLEGLMEKCIILIVTMVL